MLEFQRYIPKSYAEIMHSGEFELRNHAESMTYGSHQGGMFNIVGSENDQAESERLLSVIQSTLSVDDVNVQHIDVGSVINAINLGINRNKLGLPEQEFENQSPVENFFQYVFKGFGDDGRGWKIGLESRRNELLEKMDLYRDISRLSETPFGDFINGLDIDLAEDEPRKIIVLHYPELVDHLEKPSEANFARFEEAEEMKIRTHLGILDVMFRHNSRLYTENPQGHVIVNMFDDTYRWFARRAVKSYYFYEMFQDITTAETPQAHEEEIRMRNIDYGDFAKRFNIE